VFFFRQITLFAFLILTYLELDCLDWGARCYFVKFCGSCCNLFLSSTSPTLPLPPTVMPFLCWRILYRYQSSLWSFVFFVLFCAPSWYRSSPSTPPAHDQYYPLDPDTLPSNACHSSPRFCSCSVLLRSSCLVLSRPSCLVLTIFRRIEASQFSPRALSPLFKSAAPSGAFCGWIFP
jgi:hypothetical protein